MIASLENLLYDYIAPIGIAFVLAWVVHRIARHLATTLGSSFAGYIPPGLRIRKERSRTLNDLTGSLISFAAFASAMVFSLGRFIDTTTLVWMVGLLSAGFGIGARPLISDILTGLSFMFEDSIQIGEKVEILEIQGTIERINLLTTMVRAQTGELYVVPNGEVRVIRNFSRGDFSSTNITLLLPSAALPHALPLLETLGTEAVAQFPDLLKPWQIINRNGVLGQQVELTLVVQVKFGRGAEMRVMLLAYLQARLAAAEIACGA